MGSLLNTLDRKWPEGNVNDKHRWTARRQIEPDKNAKQGGPVAELSEGHVEHSTPIWDLLSPEQRRLINAFRDTVSRS